MNSKSQEKKKNKKTETSLFIRRFQNFLKKPFYYIEFQKFCETEINSLLNEHIFAKINETEYNALVDTIYYLLDFFKKFNNPKTVIATKISFIHIYYYFLKTRMRAVKIKHKPIKLTGASQL